MLDNGMWILMGNVLFYIFNLKKNGFLKIKYVEND